MVLNDIFTKIIILLATTLVLGFTASSAFASSAVSPTATPVPNASYGESLPPWVDYYDYANTSQRSVIQASDNVSLQDIKTAKNPYNGELPPWVDYNIQVSPAYSVPGPAVLTVTGNLNNPLSFRTTDLDAFGTSPFKGSFSCKMCSPDPVNVSGRSFPLNALLDKVQPNGTATKVTFIGPGYKKSVTISEIRAHPDYVIVIEDAGTLRVVLPGKCPVCWFRCIQTIEVQ